MWILEYPLKNSPQLDPALTLNDLVPRSFKTPDEYKLGSWVSNQRTQKNNMSKERIKRLEDLKGWVWSLR